MKRIISFGLTLIGTVQFSSAGDGPGGVGSTAPNTDLRLWLKTDGLTGGRESVSTRFPRLDEWTDDSGSGLSLAPNTSQSAQSGFILEDWGVRRDSVTIVPDDTVLFMKLNELEGTIAQDQFKAAQRGTLVGNPKRGVRFFGSTATDFDGVDDGIFLPEIPEFNVTNEDISFQVWIKPDRVDGYRRIIAPNANETSGGWGLGIFNGKILFTTFGKADHVTSLTVDTGVWQLIDIYYNFDENSGRGDLFAYNTRNLHANGFGPARQFDRIDGIQPPNASTGSYIIGNRSGVQSFYDGAIADVVFSKGRNRPDRDDTLHTAAQQPNNRNPYVVLGHQENESYKTPTGWSSGLNNEISLFTVQRYKHDFFYDYDPFGDSKPSYSSQSLLASNNSSLVVMLPDENGKIGWHFGANNGFVDGNRLEHDFNYQGVDGAHGFRSFGFFSSPSEGKRIFENGRLLTSSATGASASVSSLVLGTQSLQRGEGTLPRDVSEMIIFNRDLNLTERVLVENYLATKYHQSTPEMDWYRGDSMQAGDFDRNLIGIASIDGVKNSSASGGALRISDVSFLKSTGTQSFLAGNKDGGIRAARLPDASDMVLPRWWYFDIVSDQASDSQGAVSLVFDYSEMGVTIPPVVEHQLLYSDTLEGDFRVIATADRSGGIVDFGQLSISSSQLTSGYYAIGYARMNLEPSMTYRVELDPSLIGAPQRNGNVWKVANASSAGGAIRAALSAINSERPNDGTVTRLDLTTLKNAGSGPAVPSFVLSASNPSEVDWPEISRNLVIDGPPSIYPGRLVLEGRITIADAAVEIRNLTVRNNTEALRGFAQGSPFGGGLQAMRSDLLLERVVFTGNEAEGIDAFTGSTPETRIGGVNGRFGEGGRSANNLMWRERLFSNSGDGGFGGGGAGAYGVGGFGGGDGASGPRSGGGAALGGAVFLYQGALRVKSSGFANNKASTGAVSSAPRKPLALGGAIFVWDEASVKTFESIFINNTTLSSAATEPSYSSGIVSNSSLFGLDAPDDSIFTNFTDLITDLSVVNQIDGF